MSSLRSHLGEYPTMETMEPGQSDQPVAGFRRNCLVPCSGPDCTCSVVLTKLCVIIHNFAYQPFDQLLADRTVLAARRANRATMKRPGDGDDWRLIDDPTEEEFAAVKAHANPEQRELIEVLCAAIAPVLKELIEPLREKIAELENRPHVQYRGVWKEGQPYGTGSMVTHEGSVWHANRATMQRPGAGAVRRGRDAK